MDNVAFAKENERSLWSHEKLKCWLLQRLTYEQLIKKKKKKKEEKKETLALISGAVILESKETNTTNKQKSLNSKYFLQDSTVGFDLSVADG